MTRHLLRLPFLLPSTDPLFGFQPKLLQAVLVTLLAGNFSRTLEIAESGAVSYAVSMSTMPACATPPHSSQGNASSNNVFGLKVS